MTKWYKSAGHNVDKSGNKKECWRVRPYNKALSILEAEGYSYYQLLVAALKDGNLPEMTLALFACRIYELASNLDSKKIKLQPSTAIRYRHSLCQDALKYVRILATSNHSFREDFFNPAFKGIYLYVKSVLDKIANDTWWLCYEHPESIRKGLFLFCKPVDEDYFERVL